MYKKFINFSTHYNLFTDVKTIIACISGGVDSMSMLFLLQKFRKKINFNLITIHLNHMSRGNLADQDEELVKQYCTHNNIINFSKKIDINKYAKLNKISFEMAGRKVRYDYFQEIAQQYPGSKIATAHILDDHIETILLRLFKGTGLNGMQGVPVKRDNIIRPVRFALKKDLYFYAKENNIPFSDDHTNFEEDCLRNIIRNSILPEIQKKINPNIIETLNNFSSIISESQNFITNSASNQQKKIIISEKPYQIILDITELKKTHPTIQKELIYKNIENLNSTSLNNTSRPNFKIMQNLIELIYGGKTGKHLKISDKITANIDRQNLILINEKILNWENINIEFDKSYFTDSFIFSTKCINFDGFTGYSHSNNIEYIDCEKISGRIKLRHWKRGDKFSPLGFDNKKKLSDYFIDQKIPRLIKHHHPILVDDNKIIWICGMRLDNNYKIEKSTKKILQITYKEK